jgi:hypothetical protein
MRYLKSINEAILPKELRYKNLLFHATSINNLLEILTRNFLYGSNEIDYGIATSRCKDYLYNNDGWFSDISVRGTADCQLILDRDLIKTKYKIVPYDFEEYKKLGSNPPYNLDYTQSEDKIKASEIINIKKYIIGIHFSIYPISQYIDILKPLINKDWLIYDENWELIKSFL